MWDEIGKDKMKRDRAEKDKVEMGVGIHRDLAVRLCCGDGNWYLVLWGG